MDDAPAQSNFGQRADGSVLHNAYGHDRGGIIVEQMIECA